MTDRSFGLDPVNFDVTGNDKLMFYVILLILYLYLLRFCMKLQTCIINIKKKQKNGTKFNVVLKYVLDWLNILILCHLVNCQYSQ